MDKNYYDKEGIIQDIVYLDNICPDYFLYSIMQPNKTFGDTIRTLREESGLPLRKVAAHLDIDPSTLGKIERNERTANKEMVEKLAELFSVNLKTLLVSLLSDKVAQELMKEDYTKDILKVAEEKVKYYKKAKVN